MLKIGDIEFILKKSVNPVVVTVSQMQLPGEENFSLDTSLARLCMEGKIIVEEGARYAEDSAFYQNMIKGSGTERGYK